MVLRFILLLIVSIEVKAQVNTKEQEFCFENKGLKGETLIIFYQKNDKIAEGEFSYRDYDSDTSVDVYSFEGRRKGRSLFIKFTSSVPEAFNNLKDHKWTLQKKTLVINQYGKNLNNGMWEFYKVHLDQCR